MSDPPVSGFRLIISSGREMGSLLTAYISEWEIANISSILNKIKWSETTHVMFSNIGVTSATNPALYSGWGSDAYTWLTEVVSLGHQNGCKVLCSLENDGDGALMGIVKSSSLRAQLITNLVNLCNTYNLDGIDIDWEEIAAYQGGGYDFLISDLYNALNPLGKIVTCSGAWDRLNISLSSATKVAFINVMTYDMTYSPATSVLPVHASLTDTEAGINLWINAGFPKNKLLLGIPFYGYDKNRVTILYGEFVNSLSPTPAQNTSNATSIITGNPNRGTIAVSGSEWWNGINLAKQKVDWAMSQGLGGIMVFAVGEDSFESGYSLLDAIYNELIASGGFVHGSSHTASFTITELPAGKSCQVQIQVGTVLSNKVAFTSGTNVPVSVPITMPAAGTYSVYIDVYMLGVMVAAYTDPNQVVVT